MSKPPPGVPARSTHGGAGAYTPLAHPEWRYVGRTVLDDMDAPEWQVLNCQRRAYQAEQQAHQALRLLTCSADDPSFGYPVNMYRHALQAATLAWRDGHDDEVVVVTLLHDIGYIACPSNHGSFAAALLRPFVCERNAWLLEHHAIFQDFHIHDPVAVPDRHSRERWRGHPHFEWTAEWVAHYDQNAQDAHYDCAPIEHFEPLVQRIFARPPRPIALA